jgi:hypothetical protein
MLHLLIAHVAIQRENEATPFSMQCTLITLVTYRDPSSLIGDVVSRRDSTSAYLLDLSIEHSIGDVARNHRNITSPEQRLQLQVFGSVPRGRLWLSFWVLPRGGSRRCSPWSSCAGPCCRLEIGLQNLLVNPLVRAMAEEATL